MVTIILTSSPMVTVTPAVVTPTATFAPTARIVRVGGIPGALPQALHCCAYSARCLQSYPTTAETVTGTLAHSN